MNTLLANIKAFLEADITAGNITAKRVRIGLHEDPSQLPITDFPYIALDDAGERNEESGATDTVMRVFSVYIEFGVFTTNRETALSTMLSLSDQVRASVEKEANRQKDDIEWGISIVPFSWVDEQYFYRARNVRVDYKSYELTYELRH